MTPEENEVIAQAMRWWTVRSKTIGPTAPAGGTLANACAALDRSRQAVRPITAVDRMLAFGDRLTGNRHRPAARRRTHFRFGALEVIVVEQAAEPTEVYLTNGNAVIVETLATDLIQATDAVQKLLANPPPVKRRSR